MTITPRLTQLLIEAAVKHLPPSGERLRLLDINGAAGPVLASLRADLDIIPMPGDADTWARQSPADDSADAVVAFGYVLNPDFLQMALRALRPGGRLIVVNARGEVSVETGQKLEQHGYTRILVESAVECPLPTGILVRGEKPHVTEDTLARIRQVAGRDADVLDLTTYKGRYVHLLIHQTPDKPVWRLEPGEVVTWEALAVERDHRPVLLAFSSLPKAVGFMQPAVLAGSISGVSKVARFSRETAAAWSHDALVNPTPDVLIGAAVARVAMDPASAETPDE